VHVNKFDFGSCLLFKSTMDKELQILAPCVIIIILFVLLQIAHLYIEIDLLNKHIEKINNKLK